MKRFIVKPGAPEIMPKGTRVAIYLTSPDGEPMLHTVVSDGKDWVPVELPVGPFEHQKPVKTLGHIVFPGKPVSDAERMLCCDLFLQEVGPPGWVADAALERWTWREGELLIDVVIDPEESKWIAIEYRREGGQWVPQKREEPLPLYEHALSAMWGCAGAIGLELAGAGEVVDDPRTKLAPAQEYWTDKQAVVWPLSESWLGRIVEHGKTVGTGDATVPVVSFQSAEGEQALVLRIRPEFPYFSPDDPGLLDAVDMENRRTILQLGHVSEAYLKRLPDFTG